MEKKGSFFRKKIYKILFVISIFFLISTFFTHATTRTLNGGTVSWDNNNFLNQTFWNDTPSSGDIIKALYGSGVGDTTAYTTGRTSNTCNPNTMSVEYINNYSTSGANAIPEYLSSNTIYVLLSGAHVTSRIINTNNCSAMVGSGNVTIYFSGWINMGSFGGTVYTDSKQHIIIDNLSVDGTGGGPLPDHQALYAGIYIYKSANTTINQVNAYNYDRYGIIAYDNVHHVLIANSQTYNNHTYDRFLGGGINIAGDSFDNTILNCKSYSNRFGIYLADSNTNGNKIIGAQLYQNEQGIALWNRATDNTISDSFIYSNNYGIESMNNSGNIINNVQLYNNARGIYMHTHSNNSIINNSQIYRNNNAGIIIENDSHDNIINNSQLYNNGHGIWLEVNSYNTRINNTQIYNNRLGISNTATSSGNKYYGDVKIFGNARNGIPNDINDYYVGSGFTTGSASDFPGIFTGGILNTSGIISWEYFTNPMDNNGTYMFPWTGARTDLNTAAYWTILPTTAYSYGSGILLQTQPFIYSGTNIIAGGNFDPTKYIGSDLIKITGELLGLPAATTGVNFTVTGNSTNGNIHNYSLFGDINNFRNTLGVGTETGITLTAGDGQKRVVTQLFGTPYFATHFETISTLDTTTPIVTLNGSGTVTINIGGNYIESGAVWSDNGVTGDVSIISGTVNTGVIGTYILEYIYSDGLETGTTTRTINIIAAQCMPGWNNDNFLNSGFWNNNPTTGNIICALYGDGSGGVDTTAYTSGRASNCVTNNLTVIGLNPGTNNIPDIIADNTIYVLGSGIYIETGVTNIGTCSAIIGSGTVNIQGSYTTNTPLLYSINKSNWILDNLKLDRAYTGGSSGDVLYAETSPYTTINNIQTYSGWQGIHYDNSTNTLINNAQIYNNFDYGILYTNYSHNGKINNSVIYNNGGGIEYINSNNGQINNSESHHNLVYGMFYIGSSSGQINNSEIYRNGSFGMIFDGSSANGQINNDKIYNNGQEGVYYAGNGLKITNSQIFNHPTAYGILYGGSSGQIINTQSYNNLYGIAYDAGDYNMISNSQFYNNGSHGIYYMNGANFNSINSSQVYNNGSNGIYYASASNSGIINNSQIYNNAGYGIYYLSGAYHNTNNIRVYNNGYTGIYLDASSTGNRYYGSTKVFNNSGTNIGGTPVNFYTGTSSAIGRSNGTLDQSPTMSRDYVTNPFNTSGNYLSSWSGTFIGLRGKNILFTGTSGMQYSYGSGILLQKQPVIYSGTTLMTGGTFDPTKYIGSTTTKYTGSLLGLPSTPTNTTGFTITGIANSSYISNYSVFGNITSYKVGQTINTSTGIYLATGDGTKHVITQIYSGGYFATHFETAATLDTTSPIVTPNGSGTISINLGGIYVESGATWTDNIDGTGSNVTISGTVNTGALGTYIITYTYTDTAGNIGTGIRTVNIVDQCMGSRNNDNFLNSGFWNNNPTTGNIICALYGNGTGDRTAYTQNWSGRNTTQCSGMSMNVIYTGNLNIPTLASNTIYVVTGQTSIGTTVISMANCSTVVSNTGTIFYTTVYQSYGTFYATGKQYMIFDNIAINGTGGGPVPNHLGNFNGIMMFLSKNNTINNIQTYNNSRNGIVIVEQGNNNNINNVKSYNNANVGIYIFGSGNNNIMNNIQTYNNGWGISMETGCNNNTINNSQSYNNRVGIYIGTYSINNSINNVQIYNNGFHGIVFNNNSNYNTINNSQIYNNGHTACGVDIFSGQWNTINNSQIYNNDYGLCVYTPNNNINTIDIYNNNNSTRITTGATNIKFYGQNKFFNNLETDSSPGSGNLSTGSSSDYAGLSRSNGSFITTGIMSRDYITNPINGSGNYFLPWTSTFRGVIGTGNFTITQPATYSYGSGIFLQIQPVIYSGTTLMTGGSFDPTKYIGSTTTKYTGSLLGLPSTPTNITGFTVTGIANSSYMSNYSLFGNISSYKTGITINTSTGIYLTTGDGTKRIITQIYSGGYFATHFETTAILDATAPVIVFTGSNPADNAWINRSYFTGNVDIAELYLNQFTRSWSGTNYSIYDSGLVLMLNFDKVSALGETGGIVKDVSQYANNFTEYGAVAWTGNGRRGGAYKFDGNNSYIYGNQIGNINNTGDFTVSEWINMASYDEEIGISNNFFMLYHRGGFAGSGKRFFGVRITSGTALAGDSSWDGMTMIKTTTALMTGTRYHLVGVKIGNILKVYVNGREDASLSNGFPIYGPYTGTLGNTYIGTNRNLTMGWTGGSFSGLLDEARVYNRALNSGEIAMLYNSNLNKYNTGSWNFVLTQTGLAPNVGYRYTGYASDFGINTYSTGRNIARDAMSPTFTFANNSGQECITGTLSITSAVDTGIGLHSTPYSFDGITWGISPNGTIPAQHTGTQTKTGRVRDQFDNTNTHIVTYTFNDTLPTANNFTGSTNVSSTSKTGDWKALSAATDGACGNGSIYYSGIVSQGSKGICSISGDIITYTPNVNQTGSDSCTIQIKDNENNITNIVVGRENINSIYCSDGIVNGTEQCDDGNLLTGDGCSNICTRETPTCTLIATPNSGSIPLAIGVSGTKSSRAGYSGWDAGNGYINNFTGFSTYTYTGVGTFTITAYVYNNNNPTTTGSCTTTIQSNNSIYIVQAWPEKRSQTTAGTTLPNFRMTGAKVGIYSGHILLYTGILSLGWGGTGELGISTILSGTYNITFEGESHARSMLSGIVMNPGTRIIDFTTGNNVIGAIFSNAFGQFNPYTGYYQYAGDFGTPDLTKDETIMGADYSALVPYILVPFSPNYGLDKFDLNADGVYNSSDVDIIISHWITSTSGHGITSGGWISF